MAEIKRKSLNWLQKIGFVSRTGRSYKRLALTARKAIKIRIGFVS